MEISILDLFVGAGGVLVGLGISVIRRIFAHRGGADPLNAAALEMEQLRDENAQLKSKVKTLDAALDKLISK